MAKRIKRKNDVEKTRKFETKDLKGKRTTSKESNNTSSKTMKIILLVILVLTLILCFIKLGAICTVVLAFGILIILGIYALLKSSSLSRKKKKVINIILIIILTLGIICLVAFSAFLIYITVSAPKFNPDNLDTQELSIMYDSNGQVIAKLGAEKREKVKYDELPQVLIDAIVSTEDSRFYQHNGFDAPRFFKATLNKLLGDNSAGGASTLSMQVVKNSFTDASQDSGIKGIIRKFTDIYLAVFKLEKNYTKEEIIEFYVNNHYLGGNIYGVEEASQAYFNKSVGELNLSEATIIAGMFKNPGGYSPTLHPDNAAARRKTVLYLMRRHGYITEEEQKLANSIPVASLTKDASGNSTSNGVSPYQSYIDTVVKELDKKYNVNPYKTSLLIYTNMDRSKQEGINRVFNEESYKWVDDQVFLYWIHKLVNY